MQEQFERTAMLLGAEAVGSLARRRVAVFGIGGVGGYVCEALIRSGVGTLDIIDKDVVDITNLNRQIIATHSSIGKYKVDVMKERLLDINPAAIINAYQCFYLPETADDFDFKNYDYVVDAVDTVTAKLTIVERAKEAGVPVISSMGAGNKLDPTAFRVSDIYKTKVCPLAKVMRRELKKRGIDSLKVVYSEEVPSKISMTESCQKDNQEAKDNQEMSTQLGERRRSTPGSVAYVPSVAGLVIASEVIRDFVTLL